MTKKFHIIFILLILSACTSQVTVTSTPQTSEVSKTSEVLTETSIPIPTLHPDFVALQNFIDDSSERFLLNLDGTVEELTTHGVQQTVPNLHVDQNGIINLIINNEHLVIEQSQITFDDENGITIEGYELQNDEWVEVEKSTIVDGLEIVLGDEPDANGNTPIVDFPYPDNYTSEAAQKNYDAGREAIADLFPGAEWMQTPEGNLVFLGSETEVVYAAYERVSELYKKYDFVIDWDQVTFSLLSETFGVFEFEKDSEGHVSVNGKILNLLIDNTARALQQMHYKEHATGITTGSVCVATGGECVFVGYADLQRATGESMRALVTVVNGDGETTTSFAVKNFVKKK